MHIQYSTPAKLLFFYIFISFINTAPQTPKLTVIFVVDQFAYSYLNQINTNYFKGGLKILLHKGINFTNAHMPHAMPATAPGHVALNTGTTAQYHGIIGNGWFDETNTYIGADDDPSEQATVFGSENIGKSAINIKVDGISYYLCSTMRAHEPHYVYALSMKSLGHKEMPINLVKQFGLMTHADFLHRVKHISANCLHGLLHLTRNIMHVLIRHVFGNLFIHSIMWHMLQLIQIYIIIQKRQKTIYW